MSKRPSGRNSNQPRKLNFEIGYTNNAAGSVLSEFGKTRVLCTASVEAKIPGFLRGQNKGWVTAEYGMLPGSTHTRSRREASRGKQTGRTQEIQRLIGRSIRASIDLAALDGFTITLDCDVLEADGGTRTAAISGSYVALVVALDQMLKEQIIKQDPMLMQIAAISVGVYKGQAVLDLDYQEDSNAETDMNIVMNSNGQFIEIQGTAEGQVFSRKNMNEMIDLAINGIESIILAQNTSLKLWRAK
ncbi:MAG: ribonuclease PH [Pseudomonadota bacterium]|nr:ribonuclease PH [Pseudomonadota bacterium]